ncbi:MAG: molybdopterin molybdotransferase MoeA [Anaerolineales bacterium]|nr:molybdopterin molybdotransferase MoeA [Anaerolineales bacterium]
MNVFFNVQPPEKALSSILKKLDQKCKIETIKTTDALDRVTAKEILSPHPLPTFRRGTMDGYAVRAVDTYGASSSLPAYLRLVGEVPMGKKAEIEISAGEAVIIHTGGHLPENADAVVQIENTQLIDEHEVEILKAVAVGENIIQIGEDIVTGDLILPAGHWLRPQDLGGLLALGLVDVPVAAKPRVAIISSGDEVRSPEVEIGWGEVRDINSFTIAAQTKRAGGEPINYGIVKDDLDTLQQVAQSAIKTADIMVLSAGSSVSARDITAKVIGNLGEPGILFHGVAVRPGKPTIGAIVNGKPIFGLPGNPVSAMNLFDLLVVPTIYHLLGCQNPPTRCIVRARVTRNVAALPGREDHIAGKLVDRDGETWVEPIFGKSNLIFTLVNSDGTFMIPLDAGGVIAGEWVEVRLF